MGTKQHSQPCWDCQNCRADVCRWIGKGKPVRGWVAEVVPEKVQGGTHTVSTTYSIEYCPNFKRDEPKLTKAMIVEKLAKENGISTRTAHRRLNETRNFYQKLLRTKGKEI